MKITSTRSSKKSLFPLDLILEETRGVVAEYADGVRDLAHGLLHVDLSDPMNFDALLNALEDLADELDAVALGSTPA